MKKSIFWLACAAMMGISGYAYATNYGWIKRANYGGGNRAAACGFAISGKGYVLTGLNGVGYKDVWQYDTTSDSWTSKSAFGGTARYGASAVAIGGCGFVIGGQDGSGFQADVWKYFPSTDSWSNKTSCPGSGRYLAVAVADSANGKIYYGCGDNGTSTYLNDWWEYTPSTDTWKSLTAFPGGQRSYPAGFCLNGKIYVGTGNNNDHVNEATSDWWVYDPGTDSWSSVASVPGSPRRDASCFVLNGMGYICLGVDGNGPNVSQKDLYMYDPVKNTWTSEANYGGGPASNAPAFVIGNNAYVGPAYDSNINASSEFYEYTIVPAVCDNWIQKANYGGGSRYISCGFSVRAMGYILTGNNGSMQKDVWAYDSAANSWSAKSSFGGTAREGAGAVAIGGCGFVIGGKDGSGFQADVWKYFPSTDSWSSKTACPGGGRYLPIIVADSANGKIYYGCGDNGTSTYLSDWWEYTPSTDTWVSKTAFSGGQRSYGTGFCINGKIYAGTGNNNDLVNDASSDWWVYDPGTDSWSSVASVPGSPRRDASCFVLNGMGYLCLGIDGYSSAVPQNDLWMYDPTKNTWTAESNYGGGKASCAVSFSMGNVAYVGTGLNSTNSNTNQFWEYKPCSSGPTAIDEAAVQESLVSVYPNPGHGIINFSFGASETKKVTIEIVDIFGRVIDTHDNVRTDNSNVRLDESNLSAGVYFYRISEAGKLLANGKFIIVK